MYTYREADTKVTKEAYKLATRRKNELFIEFYCWKREPFRTAELEKSKELWDTVKREMNRNMDKCERTKGRKLERLRREKEKEDGLRNELNGEDIVKSKEERKELRVKTRTDQENWGESSQKRKEGKAIRRERRGEKENLNSLGRA